MSIQYAYTLTFSDPNKTATIIVPSTTSGSGKNNYDTSLDLVGPGYTAYGSAVGQNFVKLLENFSGPNPPVHAIEGQLWYDTSNPLKKVLRVNNGELSSSRWPTANGIYQQADDPSVQYLQNVKQGDVWVDIASNQLKIRFGEEWTLVGPSTSVTANKTGVESALLESTSGPSFPVVLNWVDGKVVEIISYYDFTPRIVIDGFSNIRPGVNLTTKVSSKFNGLAERASSLEISRGVLIKASEVLKNKIAASAKQTHTGTFAVESINGLIVKRNSTAPEIKIYSDSTNAYVTFTGTNAYMRVGLQASSYISFNSNGKVGINTTASILTNSSSTLSVNGGANFTDNVTVSVLNTSATALAVNGSVNISGNVNILSNTNIVGKTTVSNTLTVVDLQASTNDGIIGTVDTPFSRIYVEQVGRPEGPVVQIFGTVTTATNLEAARTFKVEGVVSSTNVSSFNGTQNVTFTTTAHRSLITSQETTTTINDSQTLLVVNTSSSTTPIQQISRANFLADIYYNIFVRGMIVPFGGSALPPGWAACNGMSTPISGTLTDLFSVIGSTFNTSSTLPGNFSLPNMTTSTFLTTGTSTGTYLQYIIKI